VIKSLGGSERRVTRAAGPVSWSPDGTRIGYLRGSSTEGDLYVIRTDGSKVVRLSDELTPAWGMGGVAWSPSGRKLAYTEPYQGALTILDLRSGKRLSPLSVGLVDSRLSWSPDGTMIAAAEHDDKSGGDGIYTIDASSGRSHRVIPYGDDPQWQPRR
jgi:Tol biopolymer transport system component